MKICEGAPWCLMPIVEGTHACAWHNELPAKKMFSMEGGLCSVEEADVWKARFKRHLEAKKKAVEKAAASDAKVGEAVKNVLVRIDGEDVWLLIPDAWSRFVFRGWLHVRVKHLRYGFRAERFLS